MADEEDGRMADADDVNRLEGKVDELTQGFGDFRVEITRGFAEMDGKINLADQRSENHATTATNRLDSHGNKIEKLQDRQGDLSGKIDAVALQSSGPTRAQAGAAVGGAGALTLMLQKFWEFMTSGGGPASP